MRKTHIKQNLILLSILCSIFFSFACSIKSETPTKKIAITFDDAPRGKGVLSGQERTTKLIESLSKAKVNDAMFFLTTRGINNKSIKRIDAYQKAGHTVANHSEHHLWLHKTTLEKYQKDFLNAHNSIKNYPNFKPYFRFPFLDEGRGREKIDAMRAFLKEQNYKNAYVTVDNYDWYMAKLFKDAVKRGDQVDMQKLKSLYVNTLTEAVIFYDDLALKYLKRSPKHILLLHENDLAAYFIDDLVENLRTNGWEIISPLDALQDPISTVVTETTFNGNGRIDAIARDMGAKPESLYNRISDEEYLNTLFKETGVFSSH